MLARMGLTPIRGAVEGPAPDAALRILRLSLRSLIGIAGLSAKIDGVACPHHRLTEIGGALGGTDRDDAPIAVVRARLAVHPTRLHQRGQLGFCRASAKPGLAARILTGLMQLGRVDAEDAVLIAVAGAERIAVDRRDFGVGPKGRRLVAAIMLDEKRYDHNEGERDQLAERLGKCL